MLGRLRYVVMGASMGKNSEAGSEMSKLLRWRGWGGVSPCDCWRWGWMGGWENVGIVMGERGGD